MMVWGVRNRHEQPKEFNSMNTFKESILMQTRWRKEAGRELCSHTNRPTGRHTVKQTVRQTDR